MNLDGPVDDAPDLPPPAAAEQALIDVARSSRQQCICGGECEPGAIPLTAVLVGRLRRYLAEHPDHAYFQDDEGNVAMVLDRNSESPDIRAAPDLESLLDELDAGPVTDMS